MFWKHNQIYSLLNLTFMYWIMLIHGQSKINANLIRPEVQRKRTMSLVWASNSPPFFSISFNFVTKAKSVGSLRNTNPVEIFDKMKIDCKACLPERRNFQGHRDWAFQFPNFPSFLTWSYFTLTDSGSWLLSKQCIS